MLQTQPRTVAKVRAGRLSVGSGNVAAITLRLFAAAREAAGTGSDAFVAETVGAVLDQARARYGDDFGRILEGSRVWLNGEAAGPELALAAGDEVAVLPPVSGGG